MKSQRALETTPLPYPQTPESANAWFISHGICKTDWAKAHEIHRAIVVDLLRGRLKGLRGESHRAAIALGLKADPKISCQAAEARHEHRHFHCARRSHFANGHS